ncbi:MAG: SWF/SNF helicase family protein [Candidatus Lokiarchaeota archaeon]|nr:SWF/SNF helicase family protein [Candidatus Lokiarchaeota archaeon]
MFLRDECTLLFVRIEINPQFQSLAQDIKDYCGCLIHFFRLHESSSKMQYPNMRIIMNWIINNLHKRLISSPYALYSSVVKMVNQKKEDIAKREAKKDGMLADWTIDDLGFQQEQITRNLFDADVDVEENEDEVDETLVKNYIRVPLEYEKVSLPYLEILASNANQFMGKSGVVIQEIVRSMETEEMFGDDEKNAYAEHLKLVLKRHGVDLGQKAHRESFKARIINDNQDTKMKRLLTLVPEIAKKAKSKKVIIFTRFIDTLSYIEFYLQVAKLLEMPYFASAEIFSINGKQPVYVREQVYNKFRRSDDGILVATDCMAEGIDLQYSANILINYELTWNPNRIEQRNGRINRFGQPLPC